MPKYDDGKCSLATCILYDHHNAVNKIEIRLKRTFASIVLRIIENAPVCNVASKAADFEN